MSLLYKRRILLAEDDDNDAELTINALKDNKLADRVDRVEDGELLLDYLFCRSKYENRTTGIPAVLLLDLKMPKKDGIEALKEIRKDKRFKLLPVVVLTSSKEEQDILDGYELGINAYVVKPVEFDKFVEAIKNIGCFWTVHNQLPPEF